MNERGTHTIEKRPIHISQGVVLYLEYGKQAFFRNPKTQTHSTRGTFLSDLTIPVLPRLEVFEAEEKAHWRLLSDTTKKALDKLCNTTTEQPKAKPELQFFGQLQRLHKEIPHALVKEIHTHDERDGICIMKPLCVAHHIWAIPMKPIFLLRERNPKLYRSLLSFVHSLPFDNVFKRMGYLLECLLEWTFDIAKSESEPEVDCCANGECIRCFITTYTLEYVKFEDFDWLRCMTSYRPKNPLFKQIRNLLLEASALNFEAYGNLRFLEDDLDLQVDDLIVFIDRQDSELENGYINFVNEIAQNGYSHTIYDSSITIGESTTDFYMHDAQEVKAIFDFMNRLNELLRKL
ncbi:hypothetical protein [Maribacter sp. ACAM166]|uniref:hypothetical protein n=1 Tax=Maribacter sp. ACAM166 TaxID=2508996 RepID=UPI0010FD87E3|nr:hypothetical protein [Maribacter sp. ACAM166]TLP81844.1 hypothetical protein ES765_03960 [Maribacter sp. ACAM166]